MKNPDLKIPPELLKGTPWMPEQPVFDFSVMVARENAAAAFLVALVAKTDAITLATADRPDMLRFIEAVRGAFLIDPAALNVADQAEPKTAPDVDQALERAVRETRDANGAKKAPQEAERSLEYREALRTNKIRHIDGLIAEIKGDLDHWYEKDRQAQTREAIKAAGVEIVRLQKLLERSKKRRAELAEDAPLKPKAEPKPGPRPADAGDLTQGELDDIYERAERFAAGKAAKAAKPTSSYDKALEECNEKVAANRAYWKDRFDKARGAGVAPPSPPSPPLGLLKAPVETFEDLPPSEAEYQAIEDGESIRRSEDDLEARLAQLEED